MDARGGVTPDMVAASNQLNAAGQQQQKGARLAAEHAAAGRGTSGSAAGLADTLIGGATAAQNLYDQQNQLSAQAYQKRLAATGALGALGGQYWGQGYGQQLNAAQGNDAMNQFNTAISQQAKAFNAAQQGNFNNQKFEDTFNVDRARRGDYFNSENNSRANDDQTWKDVGNILGVGGGVASTVAPFLSDKRAKKNISSGDKHIDHFLSTIKAKKFDYKPGMADGGTHVGVMAQDLEKSDAGKGAVMEIDGVKHVHPGHLSALAIAGLSHLSKRLDKLESK